MIRLLPCFIAISLAATGCGRRTVVTSVPTATANTLVAGTVIDTAGSWSLQDGRFAHELTVKSSATNIDWTLSRTEYMRHGGTSRGSSGSNISLSAAGDPWFIFVESPEELWFFDGTKNLTYRFSSNSGSDGGSSINGGHLTNSGPAIPPDIVRRLPAELQKLVPRIEPPEKVPSF